jgi:hypothetical protein
MESEKMWLVEHEGKHQAYRQRGSLKNEDLENLKVEVAKSIAIFDDLEANYKKEGAWGAIKPPISMGGYMDSPTSDECAITGVWPGRRSPRKRAD